MALIKLTENHYIETSNVAEVLFRPEVPFFDLTYTEKVSTGGFVLSGAEAREAWANWRNYADAHV